MSNKPILVLRPLRSNWSPDENKFLLEQTREIQAKLDADESPIVILNDLAAYWLRPGDSTAEMDARAEAIRKRIELTEDVCVVEPDPGPIPIESEWKSLFRRSK